MFYQNKLIVFVKNKLITLDTVLPILLEMKIKYETPSEIIVFDEKAHNGIKQNVVIRDIVNYIGKETYITKGENISILRRFYVVLGLIHIFFDVLRGAKLIHFSHLNIWPFKFLSLLFNDSVYQMQGNAYSFNYSVLIREHRKTTIPKPVGRNIVYFSSNINDTLFNEISSDKVIYSFGETRTRKTWVNYINMNAQYYFDKYHKDVDTGKGVVVYILGPIGSNAKRNKLFYKTIKSLSLMPTSVPILLKPHVFTDLDVVTSGISKHENFYITHLHPSVLSTKAIAFICNGFSNTLADAKSFGVPTVEYADYDKEWKKITNGCSEDEQFVDYFIDNDYEEFTKIINRIVSLDYVNSKFEGFSRGDNGLFTALNNENYNTPTN
jgi:hypothetical protein